MVRSRRGLDSNSPALRCQGQSLRVLRSCITLLCCCTLCRSREEPIVLPCVPKRLVDLARRPQPQEEDREFPGYGHRRSFLRALATPLSQLQPPAPQVAVGPKTTQYVMGALHQKATQHLVAGLGDVQLWLTGTGMLLPGAKSEVGTD